MMILFTPLIRVYARCRFMPMILIFCRCCRAAAMPCLMLILMLFADYFAEACRLLPSSFLPLDAPMHVCRAVDDAMQRVTMPC